MIFVVKFESHWNIIRIVYINCIAKYKGEGKTDKKSTTYKKAYVIGTFFCDNYSL